jgi:hypothetical protein
MYHITDGCILVTNLSRLFLVGEDNQMWHVLQANNLLPLICKVSMHYDMLHNHNTHIFHQVYDKLFATKAFYVALYHHVGIGLSM